MADLSTVRPILSAEPAWAAYALADLQPALLPYCHWTCADRPEGSGLALLYTGLKPAVLVTVGVAAAVEEALSQASLPEQVYLSVREEHYGPVQKWYDNSADYRPMLRMSMVRRTNLLSPHLPRARRLHSQDFVVLATLYQHGGPFAPDAFAPYQLDNGVFFGIFDSQGELEAAGGTHVANLCERVAAVGNIYTQPDCRGQGFATAITQAIIAELLAEGVIYIVLNVDRRNTIARMLYEKLGFAVHCPFVEGVGVRRGA
jgi:ribosomal protein S18 acetylase RimI-like enzyme